MFKEENPDCVHMELDNLYPTKDACLEAQKKQIELQTEEYKGSIKNVTDLVQFIYDHYVRSQNRDTDAQDPAHDVVIQRAGELLHIDLENQRPYGSKEQNESDKEITLTDKDLSGLADTDSLAQ